MCFLLANSLYWSIATAIVHKLGTVLVVSHSTRIVARRTFRVNVPKLGSGYLEVYTVQDLNEWVQAFEKSAKLVLTRLCGALSQIDVSLTGQWQRTKEDIKQGCNTNTTPNTALASTAPAR